VLYDFFYCLLDGERVIVFDVVVGSGSILLQQLLGMLDAVLFMSC
jgi:hypothetical protein